MRGSISKAFVVAGWARLGDCWTLTDAIFVSGPVAAAADVVACASMPGTIVPAVRAYAQHINQSQNTARHDSQMIKTDDPLRSPTPPWPSPTSAERSRHMKVL